MRICGYDVNARIERYAALLRALESSHSMKSPVTAVELTQYEQATLRRVLQGEIYYLTPRRRNYLILRLDSFLVDGAATYDPTVLTIEHVLPQTLDSGSIWAAQA